MGSRKSDPKRDYSQELRKLWKNELVRTVFLIGFVFLCVFTFQFILTTILQTPYPLEAVLSESMVPTLNRGDLLIVQGGISGEQINADPRTGDIIVFRNPKDLDGVPLVHRAVDKFKNENDGKWYFYTKGDNPKTNPRTDQELGIAPVVPEDCLIGKVVWKIPYLGYIKIFLGSPLGMTISIVLIVALLFLGNLPSEKEKTVAEKDIDKSKSL